MKSGDSLKLNLISASVALSGLFTLSSTLFALVHLHRVRLVIADAHLVVIAGISLIYIATVLRRGKHNAWLLSIGLYAYLILRNLRHFIFDFHGHERALLVILNLLIPAVTLAALITYRRLYRARSEVRSFTVALRRAILILLIAFLYGVIGFSFMDDHDFHEEISLPTAIHYTIDQSGFTTSNQPVAYSQRARFFVDSLAAASLTAVFYVGLAFFAPIRFRLSNHAHEYEEASELLRRHSSTSEDFFKLWPADKAFYFNDEHSGFIAYKTVGGVALSVGDPVGAPAVLGPTIEQFGQFCWLNDWTPAFIHTEPKIGQIYKKLGFDSQKIGEEALVDIEHFMTQVAHSKYFRHINNKFTKLGYVCELLTPPYDASTLRQLRQISDEWLKNPGRAERGFMMGYFDDAYMQRCELLVARDDGGRIMAFLNSVQSFSEGEANFDLMRHRQESPGNINDFLMLNFISGLHQRGLKRLNMGLAPLTGLGGEDLPERSMVDNLLNLVYTGAGRFYSFQGLARFKAKYEPRWESRYIVYRGGLPGLAKTMTALLRAMSR